MAQEIANEAQDIVVSAIEKFMKAERLEIENATKTIKDQMDKTFGPSWHCVIGEGLAFDITSQKNNLLFMYYAGYLSVLLWKC
jgi:dynein light chain 4